MGTFLSIPSFGYHINTPHTAAMNPGTSTIDMRVRASLSNWAIGGNQALMGCWGSYPTNAQYLLYMGASGNINIAWVDNAASGQFPAATVNLGLPANSIKWIRGLITVTSGTCDFYTSDDGANWTPSGTQITALSANPVQVPASPPTLRVAEDDLGASQFLGAVWRSTLIIGGVTVADVDFEQQPVNLANTTLLGVTGETWTIANSAVIAEEASAGPSFQRRSRGPAFV